MLQSYGAGNPSGVVAPGSTIAQYFDTANGTQWVSSGSGFQPETGMVLKGNALNVTAAQASLLTFVAPASGLYQLYAFVAQATATGTTPGNFQVSYTDLDSGAAIGPITFLTGSALTTQGQALSAVYTINAKVGTTITISTLSSAAGAVNAKARIQFAG